MGFLDELLGIKPEPKKKKGWDFSVFDNDMLYVDITNITGIKITDCIKNKITQVRTPPE